MTLASRLAAGCAAAALIAPAIALGASGPTVSADCRLGLPVDNIDTLSSQHDRWMTATAESSSGDLTNPTISTTVRCDAYDTVTGELLGHLGKTMEGERATAFGPIEVPAGHGVRFEVFGRGNFFNGTCADTANTC